MEAFYLWLSLGHGVLIPTPYPSRADCEQAFKDSVNLSRIGNYKISDYNSGVCIPAPKAECQYDKDNLNIIRCVLK